MTEKVSIIIPTYKRPLKLLSRAVESVLNQTYSNIEIIVVDDSPYDFIESKKIEHYISSIDNGVYIKNKENLGGGLSRNVGINNSTGTYITFLDDDDIYLPDKVINQVEFMKKNDYDLTFTKMYIYNSHDKLVDIREYENLPLDDNEKLLKYHLMYHMTGTPTFMFLANKLKDIGGFDDVKMGQEFYLMLKAINNNLKIGYIDECNIKVYKHDGEAISKGSNKIIGEEQLFLAKKEYFNIFEKSEIKYIKFRHRVVIAIAHLRNKNYFMFLNFIFYAFISNPFIFFNEIRKNLKKRKNNIIIE